MLTSRSQLLYNVVIKHKKTDIWAMLVVLFVIPTCKNLPGLATYLLNPVALLHGAPASGMLNLVVERNK